ncbi:MAG: RidA family protein [Opitutus sp.]|nr:RidA family protein [Opitutus sp.]
MKLPPTPGLGLLVLALLTPLRAAEALPRPEAKLAALGLTLPATTPPVANYVPTVRTGNLVFLSGHLPYDAEGKVITGKVGRDADEKMANAAARTTTLALLASLKKEIGELSKVKRIVKVSGFVNSTDDFKAQPAVINGCSDLLVAVFGDRGKHARAALGLAALPRGAVVEIEMIVEVD